jgi:hypothetical protein
MNIYNSNIKHPLRKIWLKTPKLKMAGKMYIPNKQKQIAVLSLILYDMDDDIKKFRDCVERIEEYACEKVDDPDLAIKSCIRSLDSLFPMFTIQLPFNKNSDGDIEFAFDIYDGKNTKLKYENIDGNGFVEAYIEMSDVWMNTKEYGINWRILQMKIHPEFDFSKCLFGDMINEIQMKKGIPPPPPQKYIQKEESKKLDIKQLDNKPFIPSMDELLNMKKNLKTIKIESIEVEEKPNIIEEIHTIYAKETDNKPKIIKKKKKIIKKKIINPE